LPQPHRVGAEVTRGGGLFHTREAATVNVKNNTVKVLSPTVDIHIDGDSDCKR